MNIPQSVERGFPRTVASLFGGFHSAHASPQESSIGLGLRPRVVAS